MLRWLALFLALLISAPASAHPAPFSYLDLHLQDGMIEGTLTMHVIDAAHELGISPSESLLDPSVLAAGQARLERGVGSRIVLATDRPLKLDWTGAAAIAASDAVRLSFRATTGRAGAVRVGGQLFPYDSKHQTFVNVYEGDVLKQQWIFSAGSAPRIHYLGSAAGTWVVVKTFVASGTHHILIGPDHLLFLVALLLLGGSWRTLLKIVTAFTIGHSITLSLAALDLVTPPPFIIEPAIALTIVVVGADNLLRGDGRDLRAWAAFAFGLIHGFGFANVLREFGLPREALAWSLASFNIGVEIGQLAVVIVVASLLEAIRRANPVAGKRIALIGSIVVIAAGAYWFAQRTFFSGGGG
jgi:hydrogenase/urease accessory protein HupE